MISEEKTSMRPPLAETLVTAERERLRALWGKYAKFPEKRLDEKAAQRLVVRSWKLQNHYGINLEQFDAILAAQGGVCPVCNKPFIKDGTRYDMPAVDHCHVTGVVRGLLHNHCNRLIGFAGDSADNLARAAAYLRGGEAHPLSVKIAPAELRQQTHPTRPKKNYRKKSRRVSS